MTRKTKWATDNWKPRDWYRGAYPHCKPFNGVRYEEDVDFWIGQSPVALRKHIEYFGIDVPNEQWKRIVDASNKKGY